MKLSILFLALFCSVVIFAQDKDDDAPPKKDPVCDQAKSMLVFSNVVYSAETGDVGGTELVLPRNGSGRAWMYIFEGALLGDAIPLESKKVGKQFVLTGIWNLELTDEKGRDASEKHPVRIEVTPLGSSLRGKMTIQGWGNPEQPLKLRKKPAPWVCEYGPIV